MPIKVTCPGCGKSLSAPDQLAGHSAPCPKCRTQVIIPMTQAAEPILEPEVIPMAEQADSGEIPFSDEPRGSVPPVPPAAPAQDNQPRRPCPRCGEMIPVAAMKCRFCGAIFDANLQKIEEAKKKAVSGGPDADLTVFEWIIAIICSGIGCICGIIWIIQGKPKGKKMLAVSLIAAAVWAIIRVIGETAGRR